jgi:hypothetical protein
MARVLHSIILYVPSLTGVAGLEKTETGSCVAPDTSATCYTVSELSFCSALSVAPVNLTARAHREKLEMDLSTALDNEELRDLYVSLSTKYC